MNQQNNENIGYLTVRVSTARGAIPLENATVSIRGSTEDDSGILYSFESDSNGLTPKIPLPAPNRALSQSPSNEIFYSLWNIDVFCKGFFPARYINVAIYSGVTTVQSAELIPVPQNFIPKERYNESMTPEL